MLGFPSPDFQLYVETAINVQQVLKITFCLGGGVPFLSMLRRNMKVSVMGTLEYRPERDPPKQQETTLHIVKARYYYLGLQIGFELRGPQFSRGPLSEPLKRLKR